MDKYCCFFCPSKDYSEKSLDDACPTCGRSYGFMFDNPPKAIKDYTITKSLGRGFYGAAYVAENKFGIKSVLKISPVALYNYFQKSFDDEIALHVRVAQNADHVVGIIDADETTIVFSDDDNTESSLKKYNNLFLLLYI